MAYNRELRGKDRKDLTMSAFLNAIDGLASADDGRLLIMTTNHPERLDAALVRPGRVDYRVEFRECGPAELDRMFGASSRMPAPAWWERRTAPPPRPRRSCCGTATTRMAARLALGAAREGVRAA